MLLRGVIRLESVTQIPARPCNKSGNCRLQELAQRFGVRHIRFPNTRPQYEKDNTSYAVFRDPNKCILCGDCVRVC